MEKQRIYDIRNNNMNPSQTLQISIDTNPGERTFSILDTGVGFTHEQLLEHVGTIASSGTKKFTELLHQSEEGNTSLESIIGRFGVGFYSVFVVSEKVEIYTRSEEAMKG